MNKKFIKRVISATLILLIVIGVVIGVIFLNIYIKKNNLLIYATGTKDKAFSNSKWGMSPKEIERANKTKIKHMQGSHRKKFFPCLDGSEKYEQPLKNYKFSCYSDEIYLFGNSTTVEYLFFYNRLYKYVLITSVNGYKDVTRIIDNLKNRFGNPYPEDIKDIPYKESVKNWKNLIYTWTPKKQKIEFSFSYPETQLKNEFYGFEKKLYVLIEATYLPILNDIDEKKKEEESNYF